MIVIVGLNVEGSNKQFIRESKFGTQPCERIVYWSGDGGSIAKGFPIVGINRRRNNVAKDFNRAPHRTDQLGAIHDGSGLKHKDFGYCLSSPSNTERLLRLLGALDDSVQLGLELRNG
jgi:hypothetical protein